MKKFQHKIQIVAQVMMVLLMLASACKPPVSLPSVFTYAVVSITRNTAVSGGSVTNAGNGQYQLMVFVIAVIAIRQRFLIV